MTTHWTHWTVGYAPFNRVMGAGVFTSKAAAEEAARRWNRQPGEYKGRGCMAVKCDAYGRLVR